MSQTFETQRVSDDVVLKYFQPTEEKIHSMDTRKQVKFPDKDHLPRQMLSILEMEHPSPKERGIKGLNQFLLLRMNSRRNLPRRRWRKEQERHRKGK